MMQPGFYNMDCMDALKQFPDQFFDLAIVDPPYGDAQKIGGGVRPHTTDSAEDSTATRQFIRFNNSGRQKRYTIMRGGYNLTEPEERGPQNTVKKLLRGT